MKDNKAHIFRITLQTGEVYVSRRPMSRAHAIAAAVAPYPSNQRPLVTSIEQLPDPVLTF